MLETVIAFVGMALLVSLFLAFVVAWGRRAEQREKGQPAPPVRRRRPIVSRPLRPDAPAPSRLRASLAPLVRTASDALHRVRTPDPQGAQGANVQDAPADDMPHSPEELYQLAQAI